MEAIEYLKKIESKGYSAYIVGGYVRDGILGLESTDIDIATSAKPKDISEIFGVNSNDTLGCINIPSTNFNVDITTYRKESAYSDRHPKTVEYTDDILTDLMRRDFTMNAICMDSRYYIFDPLDGRKDLSQGIIRVIGDIDTKFREDPLRMLRALRFSVIYDLTIEKKAEDFIIENKDLLKTISYECKKKEIDKILLSDKSEDGLKFLGNLGLLKVLGIEPIGEFRHVTDLIGAWSQLDADNYPFTKVEKSRMINIREILSLGKINMFTLFQYGIYDNTVAGEILGIDKNAVLSLYREMPIHHESELALDGNDIKAILGIETSPQIKEIKKDLISGILSGNLPNRDGELTDYILKNWK